MKRIFNLLCSFSLLIIPGLHAMADGPEVIDIQLRWHHQFQFAGYYAAIEKGFYRDEGLEVRLHAGSPERQPVKEVLSGRAQYAEGNGEVVYHRLMGEPLVALAAIFQHSPSVLLARSDSGIRSVHDLVGRRVMFMHGVSDADFLTMLLNEGIALDQIEIIPSSYRIDDLVEGRIDAFNSYLTNEPYYLRQLGVDYTIIDPRSYRVDFYSDILFTSEEELRHHPERVAAVRRATLAGWRYAMDHPDEIIDLLLNKYQVAKSREHLLYEAQTMRRLILPDLVELGHINPDRFQHMAESLAKVGLVNPDYSLQGFIYDQRTERLPDWVLPLLFGGSALLLLLSWTVYHYRRINHSLMLKEAQLLSAHDELARNLRQIEKLHHQLEEQAIRDPLTNLYNRRYFDETIARELSQADRNGYPVSLVLIDVDHFKMINDREGHPAGDQVLRLLASILSGHAREGDIPCRYGGDEFILVLPGLGVDDAIKRAEQWQNTFDERAAGELDLAHRPTLSMGVAVYPDYCIDAPELLACADRMLYRAKAQGRNRVVVCERYSPDCTNSGCINASN